MRDAVLDDRDLLAILIEDERARLSHRRVSNAAAGVQGLPNVDPIYTWVRLAQRVPVRIAIDQVPAGTPLVSGMTATVTVLKSPAEDSEKPTSLLPEATTRLRRVFEGVDGRPGCIPAIGPGGGPIQSIAIERAPPGLSSSQINPGLTPGMNLSPKN